MTEEVNESSDNNRIVSVLFHSDNDEVPEETPIKSNDVEIEEICIYVYIQSQ